MLLLCELFEVQPVSTSLRLYGLLQTVRISVPTAGMSLEFSLYPMLLLYELLEVQPVSTALRLASVYPLATSVSATRTLSC